MNKTEIETKLNSTKNAVELTNAYADIIGRLDIETGKEVILADYATAVYTTISKEMRATRNTQSECEQRKQANAEKVKANADSAKAFAERVERALAYSAKRYGKKEWESVAQVLQSNCCELILARYVVSVCRTYSGIIFEKNTDTDANHADRNGNFKGVRRPVWATFIFKGGDKNHVIDGERVKACAHETWIKACENAEKEQYKDMSVSAILWISARQAVNNAYNKEQRHAYYLDRKADLFDLNAYETTAPKEWTTEQTAVNRVYVEQIDKDNVLAMREYGLSNKEIARQLGKPESYVSRLIDSITAEFNIARLEDATGTKAEKGRKDEQPTKTLKRLIMRCVAMGITYDRIGGYIGLSERRINGKTATVTEQIQKLLKG